MSRLGLILMISMLIFALGMEGNQQGQPLTVEVRASEIILKVEDNTILMPEGAYRAAIRDIEIHSRELRDINSKFNIISIERMYATKAGKDDVAQEFPEREMRAEEEEGEEEEPDLENIFLLKFPEHIDPAEIVREYEKIEEVIYAETNKTVSIQ